MTTSQLDQLDQPGRALGHATWRRRYTWMRKVCEVYPGGLLLSCTFLDLRLTLPCQMYLRSMVVQGFIKVSQGSVNGGLPIKK